MDQSQQQQRQLYESLNCCNLPRAIRWRVQLGLLEYASYQNYWLSPEGAGSSSFSSSLTDIVEENNEEVKKRYNEYINWRDVTYESHLKMTQESMQMMQNNGEENEDEGQEEEKDDDQNDDGGDTIDPLTAMIMEQDAKETRRKELTLKYRKERARRKRGITTESTSQESNNGIDYDSLNIIDKDLNRLPSPDESLSDVENEERKKLLREMLYIFSQQHKYIGYRQGMHEVASFLLYVVQTDSGRAEEPDSNDDDDFYHYCHAYYLLECILKSIKQAFDVKVSSNSRPLQDMATSILQKIKFQLGDIESHKIISSLPVPPQLYCTKWIRLLFSREVHGTANVIALWDIFIQINYVFMISYLTTVANNNKSNPNNNAKPDLSLCFSYNWMNILETTAACRIFLAKEQLTQYYHQNNQSQIIDSLMNMPPMDDIQRLVNQMKKVLLNIHEDYTNTTSTATTFASSTTHAAAVGTGNSPSKNMVSQSANVSTAAGDGATTTNNTDTELSDHHQHQQPGFSLQSMNSFNLNSVKQSLKESVDKSKQSLKESVDKSKQSLKQSVDKSKQTLIQSVDKISTKSDPLLKRIRNEWETIKTTTLHNNTTGNAYNVDDASSVATVYTMNASSKMQMKNQNNNVAVCADPLSAGMMDQQNRAIRQIDHHQQQQQYATDTINPPVHDLSSKIQQALHRSNNTNINHHHSTSMNTYNNFAQQQQQQYTTSPYPQATTQSQNNATSNAINTTNASSSTTQPAVIKSTRAAALMSTMMNSNTSNLASQSNQDVTTVNNDPLFPVGSEQHTTSIDPLFPQNDTNTTNQNQQLSQQQANNYQQGINNYPAASPMHHQAQQQQQFPGPFPISSSNSSRQQELADRLGKSAVVLQSFAMAVMSNQHHQQTSAYSNMNAGGSNSLVPSSVWDALAEIENVKRELLEN